MNNYEFKKHLGHFQKTTSDVYSRYHYIIDQDDFIKAYNDSRNNLKYALLK